MPRLTVSRVKGTELCPGGMPLPAGCLRGWEGVGGGGCRDALTSWSLKWQVPGHAGTNYLAVCKGVGISDLGT